MRAKKDGERAKDDEFASPYRSLTMRPSRETEHRECARARAQLMSQLTDGAYIHIFIYAIRKALEDLSAVALYRERDRDSGIFARLSAEGEY